MSEDWETWTDAVVGAVEAVAAARTDCCATVVVAADCAAAELFSFAAAFVMRAELIFVAAFSCFDVVIEAARKESCAAGLRSAECEVFSMRAMMLLKSFRF